MLKKIISSITCAAAVIAFSVAAGAAEIPIDNRKFLAYPTGSVVQTPYTSESKVNNVIPLEDGENTITVKLTDAPSNEIYFVSVYDMETETYITPNYGVPIIADEFVITGLTGGREYRLRISGLFMDRNLSGTISTGFTE